MAGFLADDQARKVRDATDLVQLMGEYTTLRRSGQNHTCCCPFHQERSPSCYVYDDGHYHCFGCGAHGDAITLIRDKERLEFVDAIELLARRAGIQLEYKRSGKPEMPRGERDRLLGAMELATAFYERLLWESAQGAAGRDYLASRGLSVDVCRAFRLGWAPGGGALVDEGRRRGFEAELLAKVDLAIERNGRLTDRFFERISFPICDRFGHPIAFSARLLPEAERRAKEEGRGVGKYVNSTDTPLYHKGNAVFNLHRARVPARDKLRLIVMEGPTDVMAAADAGFNECVAVLGTALTPEHAKQLGPVPGPDGRLILLLDGDRAGQTNALKALRTCLAVGVQSHVAILPEELDPAELLKEDAATGVEGARGKAAMERVLAAAQVDVQHLLRAVAPRPYELEPRALLSAADEVLECLRPLKDAELVTLYLRDAGDYLALDKTMLARRLAGARDADPVDEPTAEQGERLPALSSEQDACLHILVQRPDLRADAFDRYEFEPSDLPEAWRPLVDLLQRRLEATPGDLVDDEELGERPVLRAWVSHCAALPLDQRVPAIGDPGVMLRDLVPKLKHAWLESAKAKNIHEMAEATRANDTARMKLLYAERQAISRRLNDLAGLLKP
ncbi:MAG: DNA primase [Planctomycetes bacterium]|nr:DNA primase [Planctomycetota bacterium]